MSAARNLVLMFVKILMDIDVNGLKERHFSLMVGILKVKENFF